MKGEKLDLGLVGMFALCIVGFVGCLIALSSTIAASHNEGIPGTFTADEKFCDRYSGCEWLGTFESDDGKIRETYGSFKSPEVKRSGDEVRAQKVGGSVFRMNSQSWVVMVIGAVGCLAYIVWFSLALRRRRSRIRSDSQQIVDRDVQDPTAPATGSV